MDTKAREKEGGIGVGRAGRNVVWDEGRRSLWKPHWTPEEGLKDLLPVGFGSPSSDDQEGLSIEVDSIGVGALRGAEQVGTRV